jgi:hypothetical protein
MYTDGLSEARDAQGEFFSPLTLGNLIARHEIDEALDVTLDAVRRHVPKGHLTDDLAVLLVKNLAKTETPGSERKAREVSGSLVMATCPVAPPGRGMQNIDQAPS